ncbi:AAA family ATPase [Pseudoalteromonas sp. JC28]|uniref:AAA family ATPase n=1 Tax=Pseudoalteromonas sp. JC28 TaxID=2267617 RepID=UPI0015724015|nr:AAA family ATPase [Pseudoalteromonas sp. JC28]NSY35547.1 AAA family ATPase [Pseudoalteromonas sp. JC28]
MINSTAESVFNENFRVTSIPFSAPKLVIFSGVPINPKSYQVNSGKYYVTIKANPQVLPVMPSVGQHWNVAGLRKIENKEIDNYVMQQHTYEKSFQTISCTLPESNEELINFIAKEKDFQGIGAKKARLLCNALGDDFYEIMNNDSLTSRTRLRSFLSDHSINELFKGYAKYRNLSHCNWMSKNKIPSRIQQQLLKHHDEKTIDAIKKNPFILVSFGMTFKEVDSLVKNSEFNFEMTDYDHRRLSAALEFALRKQIEKGHTFTSQTDLRPQLSKLFNNDKELISATFRAGYNKAQYVLNPDTGNFHPTAQLLMENTIAKRLIKLAKQKNLYDEHSNAAYHYAVAQLPYEMKNKLTKMQIEAIVTCLDNAVSCITGGAGTGKTTVLNTVLKAYSKLGYDIHAIALSGRAAMRLHESIGFDTLTIARFLKNKPIEIDLATEKALLVIDEASMIDVPTMYRLVTHIHPSVKIIFTGDPNQLPPIGSGKVLSDIVESQVIANTMLDIVKRSEETTGIPEYSRIINDGEMPDKLSTGNIHFHQTQEKDIADVCCELYSQAPFDSKIIAPSKALVAEINKLTQDLVNPYGERLEFNMDGERQFVNYRQDDVIMFTQNHYDKDIRNGSLGTLSNVESKDDYFGEITLDTAKVLKVDQTILDCIQLGYAITLHKAQGSQFKRVIIAIPKSNIIDRAWIYTAITRAEMEIHIVGDAHKLKSFIETPSKSHLRNSYLLNLLRQFNEQD